MFRPRLPRRTVLGAGLAAAGTGLLAACSGGGAGHSSHKDSTAPAADYITPDSKEIGATEALRRPGSERKVKLTAAETPLDLGGGRTVRSWAYGGELPGREVRVTAGDTLALTLANNLPVATTVHWHGLALRNDMDGVPGLTQRDIRAGGSFDYRFAVSHPGTYWFHPHSGTQLDRGLYAPLIVEDPKEPLTYDREWVIVLDDWLDGVDGSTPEAVLAELRKGMGGMDHGDMDMGESGSMEGHDMSNMSMSAATSPAPAPSGPSRMLMGATSDLLGGDAGDVAYPYYLINGRTPENPQTFTAKPGDRIRLRIINAGGDTAFRVALGGHRLTVTHTDGFPVEHTRADALLLGMGERFDALVTVGNGTFPLTALAEGKNRTALAVLRTGGGAAPSAAVRPKELSGKVVQAGQLKAAESVRLASRKPDTTIELKLTGSMMNYDWAVNGKAYDPAQRYPVRSGERVRLSFVNTTTMWHPMHLHGHTFALAGSGARKDTSIVLPGKRLDVDFDADNPGLWMIHCHNVYHAESGMMTVLGYRK
ncbi:multicopper oxidase family protein [Streptomyces sp. HNM0663]|uniref:Multicopper oxidase family protein n=1 Tax=Streptomyces chengmaiensis TaxID=3040919 RepID=A0ABT6HJT5_9ACTN|nr:multicopper oxidase family protein [Streptomyces chengmaiensis]MDH2388980.1 multicopper oxidase family protein [Streptomyces chengmaiensis]